MVVVFCCVLVCPLRFTIAADDCCCSLLRLVLLLELMSPICPASYRLVAIVCGLVAGGIYVINVSVVVNRFQIGAGLEFATVRCPS